MGNKFLQWGTAATGGWRVGVCAMAVLSGCGGNSTPVGVTVNTPTETVPLGAQFQFQATVSGAATTTRHMANLPASHPDECATDYLQSCRRRPDAIAERLRHDHHRTKQHRRWPLYGAQVAPATNPFLVVATSTINTTAFGVATVTLRSGTEVHITPSTATIAAGDHFQFTANVTGTTNTNVTWEVGGVAGGTAADGYICPSSQITVPCTAGEYFAPPE